MTMDLATTPVTAAVRTYRERMDAAADKSTMDLWYDRLHVREVLDHFPRRHRPQIERDVAKARRKGHRRAVTRLTHADDGHLRFAESPPLQVHIGDTDAAMDDVEPMIEEYRQTLPEDRRTLFDRFHVVDAIAAGRLKAQIID